jgi:hypothetical protein
LGRGAGSVVSEDHEALLNELWPPIVEQGELPPASCAAIDHALIEAYERGRNAARSRFILQLEKDLRASEAEGEALAQEVSRQREGLEEALRQLEADRYIIARNVLKGVITGETW